MNRSTLVLIVLTILLLLSRISGDDSMLVMTISIFVWGVILYSATRVALRFRKK